MSDPLDKFLLPVRQHLLGNLLRFFVVIAGIACSIAFIDQLVLGNIFLALIYVSIYFGFVFVARYAHLGFSLSRLVPVLLLLMVLALELINFGTTALSFTLIYAVVVFTGLMYGIRAALISLGLAFLLVSVRYWTGYFADNADAPLDLDFFRSFLRWLAPTIGQMALIAMTVAAVYVMFRELQKSLAEKHGLIEDLQTEIERREQAQDALKLSEETFDRLFEKSQDAVLFVNNDSDTILLANPAAEKLTGLQHDELLQRTLRSMLSGNEADSLETILQRAALPGVTTLALENSDGSQRDTEVTVTAVESDISFIILRDITEKKRLEAQLAQTHKLEAIGQLAGGIAHDFNNSLQVIIGFCELARIKLQGKEGSKELEKIHESGQRAQKLVSQLLAFSRRQHLESRPMDLSRAVEESLHLVQRIIGENIILQHSGPEHSLQIVADPTQIEQVILNLCINARDAIHENGSISIELSQVSLDEQFCQQQDEIEAGKYAKLSIIDTGCGMDTATREKIFEPFYTTKEAGKGTGLGLSSVLGIVQQHNGFVTVSSEPGQGSRFDVYLPLDDSAVMRSKAARPRNCQPGSGTILLTEDNEMVRTVTRELLKQGGYEVIEAGSSEQAIKQFEKHQGEICLVILDVIMPHMQGPRLSARLRELRPELPVLFITGQAKEGLDLDNLPEAHSGFIQKPFQQSELLAAVESLLQAIAR
ncbi:MAG: ATP-binding protein [Pseudomonadales bacterium]|nr:ATP-binding protein [Pseudomonadales bacterium]